MNSPPDTILSLRGLLLVDLSSKVAVKSEEISQLSSGINFGLPEVLALAQHSGGDKIPSVLGSGKLCRLLKDGYSVDKRSLLPALLGLQGLLNSLGDLLLGSQRMVGEGSGMLRREHLILGLNSGLNFSVIVNLALNGKL